MKISHSSRIALALVLGCAILFPACNRGRGRVLEIAYVSAPQVNLRDRVAAVYTKVGLLKNGDRVEVLDRDRRFAKVRSAGGAEGWMEQRFLVSQQVYDKLQKLTQENQNDPVQGQGTTRNDTNLHVEPGRDAEHLFQIATGEKVALLKRGTAERPSTVVSPARAGVKPDEKKESKPVIEDWWLVRDVHGRVGWVLARMVDLDVPLEVAQYAEGQRIVAFFMLDEVRDGEKKVPQYLTILTEPKDGLPFDFNQIRVFTWNVKRHRYETAYRERLRGSLPVTVAQENFEKEGTLPTFVIRVQDDSGNESERKYKLNTPIVRRVLAPGEELRKKRR
ncbi:MAG: SH3 domain-containing protein [Terriglobales bacterium]